MDAIAIICNEVIISHPWNQKYKVSLSDISNRDYQGMDYLPNRASALDIDNFEKEHSGLPDKTIDAAVGICDYDGSSHSLKRLSLVELRMGYKSCNRLKYSSLVEKVSHTKDLLRGEFLDTQVFFVFKDLVAPSAMRIFDSWKKENKPDVKNWRAIGVSAYIEERMKTESDVPYTPHHNLTGLKDSFANTSGSAEALIDLLTYWKKEINNEFVLYHMNEVKAITEAVNTAMQSINLDNISDESERELVNLYWNDFK